MLFSYLKIAIRLLVRNPFFTFLNVMGLSVGMAVFFVLRQYFQNELKSDQSQKDQDRIAMTVISDKIDLKRYTRVFHFESMFYTTRATKVTELKRRRTNPGWHTLWITSF